MVKATSLLASFLVCCVTLSVAQGDISVGLFTGATSSFTLDEGMSNDSRYTPKNDVKLIPFGFSFEIDNRHHGFLISPNIMSFGRNYHVVNILGEHTGTRKSSLTYFNLPIAYKFHLIERPSLRVNFLAGLSVGYLIRAKETIAHDSAKYRFPEEVYPLLPASTYEIESDGVIALRVEDALADTDDYNFFQCLGSFGLRTEWDVIPNWRLSLDFRANYGLMEARNDEYVKRVNNYEAIYDMPGTRNDLFASLTVGISRVIDGESSFRSKDISKNNKRIPAPKSASKKKRRR